MIYRRDLIDHFQWLEGSELFDDLIDEAIVAIALTGYDHGGDLIQNGAWQDAKGVVERFGLEPFVERLPVRTPDLSGPDATVSHMEIGVRDLRNRTAQVIDAVKAGERVVLTVNGEPTADIVPHGQRTRWALGAVLLRDQLPRARRRPRAARGARRGRGPDPGRAMSVAKVGLLDTSVFIAREDGRPLGVLPERATISAITIGELQLGVLSAVDDGIRARRADTLSLAQGGRPDPRQRGDHGYVGPASSLTAGRRASTAPSSSPTRLIAATAIEHGLPVVTQDGDFAEHRRAHPALRVLPV